MHGVGRATVELDPTVPATAKRTGVPGSKMTHGHCVATAAHAMGHPIKNDAQRVRSIMANDSCDNSKVISCSIHQLPPTGGYRLA